MFIFDSQKLFYRTIYKQFDVKLFLGVAMAKNREIARADEHTMKLLEAAEPTYAVASELAKLVLTESEKEASS